LDKKFSASKYINQLEELKHRFGVSKNIDDKIYTIKLQFSESTGNFVQKLFWHPTQKITKHKKNFILEMECGINRELVGWIFQWMHNIKILEPPELIDIYQQTLKEIEANKNVKSLFSRNMITQKRKTLS
jgi:predicted DNA-binding transcriptional regulator YafY